MATARKSKVDPEAAFLDAICAGAEDDAPRLVYADYLLESGDAKKREYGEFIIAQCEVAKHPRRTPEGQRAWLRECDLEPIINRRKRYGAQKWERGFPVVISSTPTALARTWKQLAPLPIRQVMLYDRNHDRVPPTIGELGFIARALPHLETIRFANNEASVACDAKMLVGLEEGDEARAWPDGTLPRPSICDAVTVLTYSSAPNVNGPRAGVEAYIKEAFPKLESLWIRSMRPDAIMAISNRLPKPASRASPRGPSSSI